MTHLRQAILNISRQGYSCNIQNRLNQITRNATTSAKKLTSLDQYHAEKQALKQRRTELYKNRQTRKESLKGRQDNKKKNYLQKQFREYFDAMASKQAFLDREARRQGKKWNIKVATMVERLPVVTRDRPEWETDFLDLKAELAKYDRIAYPKELGFPDPMDMEVLTEEELFGKLWMYRCYYLFIGTDGSKSKY